MRLRSEFGAESGVKAFTEWMFHPPYSTKRTRCDFVDLAAVDDLRQGRRTGTSGVEALTARGATERRAS